MTLGTARSTDSGSFSWIFLGTIDASPPSFACVLLVDWLFGLEPVGWIYNTSVRTTAAHDFRLGEHTPSGRLSSRPFGAASWTLLGTADSPVAWDLPCPYSLVEDILTEVCLKIGDCCWMRGREIVRSLRVKDMVSFGWYLYLDDVWLRGRYNMSYVRIYCNVTL